MISASTAARSQCLGQVQLKKSQSGLKRLDMGGAGAEPLQACGGRVAAPPSSSIGVPARAGSRPRTSVCVSEPMQVRSASARASRVSFSVFGADEVSEEASRFSLSSDRKFRVHAVAPLLRRGLAGCAGSIDADRFRWLAALLAPPRQGQAHGGRDAATPRCSAFEDGGLHFGGAGLRQQAHQCGGDGAEIGAAFGGADQQGLGWPEPVRGSPGDRCGAVPTRGALLPASARSTWSACSICASRS